MVWQSFLVRAHGLRTVAKTLRSNLTEGTFVNMLHPVAPLRALFMFRVSKTICAWVPSPGTTVVVHGVLHSHSNVSAAPPAAWRRFPGRESLHIWHLLSIVDEYTQ